MVSLTDLIRYNSILLSQSNHTLFQKEKELHDIISSNCVSSVFNALNQNEA